MNQTIQQAVAMGSPVWPATRSNLLMHCREQRRHAKRSIAKDAIWHSVSIRQAQRCLLAMRAALSKVTAS